MYIFFILLSLVACDDTMMYLATRSSHNVHVFFLLSLHMSRVFEDDRQEIARTIMLIMRDSFILTLQFCMYLSNLALDRSDYYVVNISFEQTLLTMYVSFVFSFDDSVREDLKRRR